MKKKAIIGAIGLIFTFIILTITSCTTKDQVNINDKHLTVDLKPGQKFVSLSFDDTYPWVITRPFEKGELPTTYTVYNADYPDGGQYMFIEHSLTEDDDSDIEEERTQMLHQMHGSLGQ